MPRAQVRPGGGASRLVITGSRRVLCNVRCCHDRRITTRGDARHHHGPAEDTFDPAVVSADQQHSKPESTHPVACLPQGFLPTYPCNPGAQGAAHYSS